MNPCSPGRGWAARRTRIAVVAAALLASILATAPAAGAVTLDGARAKALQATKAERGRGGVILFGLRVPIRARASIRESGHRPAPAGSSRRIMPKVLRVGSEPAFFFYLDRGAYQASQHVGRVVLVGVHSGKVVRSRRIRFSPAIDGRLPTFLRSRAGYEAARYRVAARDYAVAGATERAVRGGLGSFGAATPRSAASESVVERSLAAEHSCTVAIGGRPWEAVRTLGSASGSAVLPLLLYDPTSSVSLRSFVASQAIAKRGCRDILVAISGDGYRSLPTPTVRTRLAISGSRMREYHVSSAMLRSLIGANPSVTFKLLVDAPGSGGFIESLKSLSNVLVISTSSTAAQTAYRYLPRKRVGGDLTANLLRMRADSSFLTTMLFGGAAFAASDAEVGHAAAEVAAGRAPSFLAYLVARAFALSRPFDFTADLGATQRLYVHGFTPTPPGSSNSAPVATPQSVTTAEDTAKAITLAGSDTDGDPLTFAVAGAPAHGVLGGTAPNLTYTPAADYEGPDSLTFTVSDGSLVSAAATVAITVSAVDDPPVTSAGGTLAYTENDPPTAIAPSLTVVDGDSSSLTGATVQITANLQGDEDVLALAPQPGLTISYDAPTGTLTLSGDASVAAYQVALRAVSYANTSDDPSASDRTVSFRARDAGGFGAASVSTITVTPVNDPPAILTSLGPLSYTENEPAKPVDGGLVLSDPDSQITGASVQITNNHASPQDILALASPPAAIGAAYNSATGKLTLSGTATVAAYQAALRAVTYRNSSSNPTTTLRTLTFLASDASSTSAPATRNVAVNATDNAPDVSVDSAGALLYTENQAATAVDPAITITDPDSVNLTGASAQIAGNYVVGEDVLDTPPGLPGGIAAAFDAPTGRLTLSGIASVANYAAALEAVRYANTSDDPSSLARTVTFQARDAGGFGNTDSRSITIVAADDAPVAVNDSAMVAEDSGAGAVAVITNDTDVDGGPKSIGSVTQPANGTVVITGGGTGLTYAPNANYCNTPPGTTLDTFTYTLTPGGSIATVSMGVTCVDDPPVAVGDNATVGEDSGANAIAVLVNDVDVDGGPKSVAAVTQPANGTVVITGGGTAVTYAPSANYCNTPPGTTPDTFTYTLTPGSSAATVSMTVTCSDDPPVAVNDNATVGEDSGANAVDVLANDADVDGGPKSVTSVTQPANGSVVVTGGGTGVSYTPNANYCNSPPGGAPDVFTYTLNGGDVGSVAMTVTCTDDAPVVDNSGPPLAYSENDPPSPIDGSVTVTDTNVGATIVSATVQVTANYAGPQDVLALNNAVVHLPITAMVIGNTITLSGAASPAAYQAALRDVTYFNSSEAPSTLARTATFTVTDNAALSGSDSRAIVVVSVDDDPVAVGDGATVLEDAGATPIPVLINDTDLDGGPKAIVVTSQPANGTVVITGGGTGLTYQPVANYCNDPPGTTPDTFTYTLTPGGSTATVSMTVTCVNDLPVADDETITGPRVAIGNTALIGDDPSDGTPTVAGPKKTITADILDGDVDVDGPGPLIVTAGTFPSNDGGTVVLESDGDFTFTPAAGTSCSDANDFFDYTVSDQNTPTPGTDVGRVNIVIVGCIWYVHNNAAGNAGTSTAPFDTLAQAESASAANQTIFVFDGDNTSTGYGAGIDLKPNQRLVGEAADLVNGADFLHAGIPANRPTLTDNNADVVALASGNSVRGIEINPQGTGSGIAGGSGDATGLIDDVRIIDTGAAGTQPSLELDTTTGAFDISNLTIDNSAATGATSGSIGVRLDDAGTVNFANTGTISITTAGAKGLEASGPTTSLGAASVFDAITVTGSGSGGVSMTGTTGTTTFANLSLTTTSGADGAFVLNNAGNITVSNAGTANVSSNGGPAVLVSNTTNPTLDFDNVSVVSSGASGIFLDGIGAGTFSAGGGTLAGIASGVGSAAFRVNGGSGAISYAGDIADGTGGSVLIQSRTGGTVALSGTITDGPDVNGGPGVVGNSGGSTVFSGPAKTFSTGAGAAVQLVANTGHTISFTNGGLDVDTTSGVGLVAQSGGTVNITGAGNTIDTATGNGLLVDNTNIGASNVTFEHVSTNGAAVGIRANATGASGRLIVTGNGGTCTSANTSGCTGGQIANGVGADDSTATPTGTGIVLNNTVNPSLTRMWIHDHSNYGIRGTSVAGFTMADSVINGSNGTSALTAHKDGSARFEELTGTVNVTNTAISGGFFTNLMVDNTAGVLNATLDNVDSGTLDATGGDDAVQFEGIGTSDMNVDYRNSQFTTASGDLFQYIGDGTGGGDLDFTGNALSNNEPSINTGGGGVALVAGAKGAATMDVLNNTMRDSKTNALTIIKSRDNAAGANNLVANIANNAIGLAGTANSGSLEGDGMEITTFGDGNATFDVTNNAVRQYNSSALQFVAGSGIADSGQFNLNVTGNSAANPGTNPSITLLQGIRVDSGVDPGDTFATCVNFGLNSITGSSDAANKDFRLVASQSTTMRQPGYAGGATDGAAFAAFAAGKIGGGAQGTAAANAPGTFSGAGTTCP